MSPAFFPDKIPSLNNGFAMMQTEDDGAMAFFKAQHRAFLAALAACAENRDILPALISLACSSFDGNVEIQARGQPEIACHKGCAACCTIRVVATAPEVLMAARYIRFTESDFGKQGLDLRKKLEEADSATRNRSERERVALRRRCPFISKGACVIYPVRPLACRGHASYEKIACMDAAAGRLDSVPFSMPHMMVRSLVQNAMQSALRDSGLAWAAYELNHALMLALSDERCEAAWMAGEDVFADAQVADIDPIEMAAIFDSIQEKAHGPVMR